jgi:NAD+ kinase
MKIAIYVGKDEAANDQRLIRFIDSLSAGGCSVYMSETRADLKPDTDMLVGVGGDGSFLLASMLVGDSGIPVLGLNLGRLGFLSENPPENLAQAILSGDFTIQDRAILKASISPDTGSQMIDSWPYALNEIAVHRRGAAMLGVDVTVDGFSLPTYWSDGLLVSTSSGSTAYSLSVGGPIVLPEAKVLIVTPIAPHNLNVRPLVVPDDARISLKVSSRDMNVTFTADNRSVDVKEGSVVNISLAQFSLKRVRLNDSDFINALTEKLYWGEDVRNTK